MLCFLCRFWIGGHEKGPEIGVRGPTVRRLTRQRVSSQPAARNIMRRCLLQQRRTLGHRNNLSSRFFVTVVTQASWHHAVEQKNASVNALVHVVHEAEAGPVSEGPLNGMTVAVKDNICTKNMPTTCSSAMLRGMVRSTCDNKST
jgi:Amidase